MRPHFSLLLSLNSRPPPHKRDSLWYQYGYTLNSLSLIQAQFITWVAGKVQTQKIFRLFKSVRCSDFCLTFYREMGTNLQVTRPEFNLFLTAKQLYNLEKNSIPMNCILFMNKVTKYIYVCVYIYIQLEIEIYGLF